MAFEHLVTENQRKIKMEEQKLSSIENKYESAMEEVKNLTQYDRKLKENVIKSMAYEFDTGMRFKQKDDSTNVAPSPNTPMITVNPL